LSASGRLAGAAAVGLVFAALFFAGGSTGSRVVWIGGAAVVLAAVGAALALLGVWQLPRLEPAGAVFVLALVGLVAWSGASLGWSIVPDQSWDAFDRGIVYVAFAVGGVVLAGLLPRAPRRVAAGFAVLLFAVLGWAVLGKVFPALYTAPPGSPVTRLRNPVGYWNALALLGDAALPLALWIAAPRSRSHVVRAVGALLFYVAVVAVLLTYSRSGVVIGGLVVVAWLALASERLESLAVCGIAAAPAVLVALFAATRSGLSHFQPHSARVHDGAWFGLVLVLGAAVVAGGGVAASRWESGRRLEGARRRLLERRAGAALGAAVIVALVGLAFRAGGPAAWWRDFANPVQVGQGAGRLGSTGSTRWVWWGEAWHVFEKRPLGGKGAASFAVARRPIRHNPLEVTEPHNTALQFLSELGIVGFLLGGAAAAAGLAAAVRAVRRASTQDRLPTIGLGLGLGAYLLHALVDYDWEFVSVTGPLLLVAGVLAASSRPAAASVRRAVPAGLVVLAALAALYSLWAPWQAGRDVDRSYAALDRADVSAAASGARSAHRLNPFSYEPWWALAAAEEIAARPADARRAYEQAVELQPENSATWYALGQYEFGAGLFARACYALDRAYRLDPRGPAGDPGGLLDQVKRKLPGCPASTSK
jgi:tetratricopeptide (TPR) repeat protein